MSQNAAPRRCATPRSRACLTNGLVSGHDFSRAAKAPFNVLGFSPCQCTPTAELAQGYNLFMTQSNKKSDRELPEPASAARAETIEELFARIDAIGGDPLFPEGRKQNLAPVREYPWDERPSEEDPTL